ncbi:YheT family hydrolase [Formosimonas limnophila]|nr:alpha/beta fold hydrolase [Formosimonas limnophila]
MTTLQMYSAPWWARNAHIQTILPTFLPMPLPQYERERWETPDDDFIDIDWVNKDLVQQPNQRLIILFHGLEGSSSSPYAKALMNLCHEQGHTGAVIHWRSCSGEVNRQAIFYHSGFSSEIDWILRRMAQQFPHTRRHVAGVSLGGNALIKWLGEQRADANAIIKSAAAICPPHDLKAGAVALSKGFNQWVYMRNFLSTLKRKGLQKLTMHPNAPIDAALIQRSQNFFDLDNAITAPLHGYKDAEDYWARASCKSFMRHIQTPTLVLNALNDPFIPAESLAKRHEASTHVHLEYTTAGGHVGFIYGKTRVSLSWLPRRVMRFFETHSGETSLTE